MTDQKHKPQDQRQAPQPTRLRVIYSVPSKGNTRDVREREVIDLKEHGRLSITPHWL